MKDLRNLLPNTAAILQKLAKTRILDKYTFVGGSALTLYLNHRYSEDIDLFSWEKSIDINKINKAISEMDFQEIKTVNITGTQADFIIDGVKVTFFANDWPELKNRSLLFDNLYIAKLEVLAAMKVNTLFMRAKFRDYYDLYVLNKEHFSLNELYEFANRKMLNLSFALFQRALTFTGDIEDETIEHLKPKYKLSLKDIENHFVKEIKKVNNNLKI
jgi:predicted nucleotidyltransferase component of viral defense system